MNDDDIRNDDPTDPTGPTSPTDPTGPADPASPGAPEDGSREEGGSQEVDSADAGPMSIYVRRRRTPALGFWVALAIVVPAVVALLISPLFDFVDATGVLNFMLTSAVFIGVPLAAIAAGIDAFRHRSSGPRGR